MLVLASPRPPENQEVVVAEDVTTTENFFDSAYVEIPVLGNSVDPNPPVPLLAFSARARHRQKVRPNTLVLIIQTEPGC